MGTPDVRRGRSTLPIHQPTVARPNVTRTGPSAPDAPAVEGPRGPRWSQTPAWAERAGAANEGGGAEPTYQGPPAARLGAGSERPIADDPQRARPADRPADTPGIGARTTRTKDTKDPPTAQRNLPPIRYDSADAGDFYCEHVFHVAQREALASSSSVMRNGQGERLVGFIHIPQDSQATQAPDPTPTDAEQAARHAQTRQVVGAGIAGYFDEARTQTDGPVRIMLSGFGTFGSFTNNPSGDFVSHRANIDAAMEEAFGANLVGRPPANADMNQPLTYRVRQQDGTEREVQIRAVRLSVDDAALDPARAGSIPHTMRDFAPHAVISMGLRPGSQTHYDVENHADDGGLATGSNGTSTHQRGRASSTDYANRSLERAIESARQTAP
ncbi:MAG: hypothetical protein RMA76_10840 [Deltaproteobacteria bacterium]|jgi:pyrrolidone-carboxylate peptidase